MRKRFVVISILTLLMLATSFLVTPASAQGIFDEDCPHCHGTGKITVEESCGVCQGTGEITKTCDTCRGGGEVTCTRCDGSGTSIITVQCSTCYGSGKIQPTIITKSVEGWGTLVGLDWVARIQGVFHNEEDQGAYATVTARVETVRDVYEESVRTYFPPHEEITVTIDIEEIEYPWQEWLYTMYISASDDITCPDCNGTGGKSQITTCPDCHGTGKLTCPVCNGAGEITTSCVECGGDGKIESKVSCPHCGGRGYVTDWAKVGIVSIIGVGAIGVLGFAVTRRKKP